MFEREQALIKHYDEHLEYYSIVSPETVQIIFAFMGKPIVNTVTLDLGCGTGFFASEVAKRGGFCHGVDYSSNRIALAKQRYEKARKVEFSCADIHEFLARWQTDMIKVQSITAWEVLEHLEQPRTLIDVCLPKCQTMYGSVPINMPYEAHLQVYKDEKDVREKLRPDRVRQYRGHFLLQWYGGLR